MREKQFKKYYEKYLPAIRGIARKLAGSDNQLAEDLEQVGAFTLSQLNPRRATSNESAWIRRAVKNRMFDFLRSYEPGKYESLDARLDAGDQLEMMEGTNEIHLFTNRTPTPKLIDETEWESLPGNTE